ncbi:MAG: hypothetical protein ACD_57C00125G0002 [uncultured bacterium]|uniref:Uncharacterized protein n=1 Tax=Candidatus Curtissbacteria bacterium RIFOXYA1_FULL_41_14 TaxID=1797737 RepID=A0A1F5HGJ5_9BACT|nr:MAG: hypothetical protein ACD_57C00125G0002 [uncultured bacterium]KKR58436.1 MAG: hypothetical protein UT95_C0005G0004 [Candidatus Curtissbacteria bacterium GW2011_GWB1_40_28]KKR61108.1 MAG: hypothetical protein UT99_C0002G0037 [Candidatus Curtissbacteria bacterium GW2011_GWA2_40_31]KKR61989.1 MAG: hypothetical protein UU00_C0005G0045 [Microgenomates group bacterium GW2011_GWC1_40_35]KKR66165.1 MAG: hypothetical protein UU05_C0004G0013 [Candidatus Curtissbacteria bacterium GW2011_GWA1_40_47]
MPEPETKTAELQGPKSWNAQPFKDRETETTGIGLESQPFSIPGVGQAVFRVSAGYLGKGLDTRFFTRPVSILVEVELVEDDESRRTFDYWRRNLEVQICLKNQKILWGYPDETNKTPNKILFDRWTTERRYREWAQTGDNKLEPTLLIVNADEIPNLRFQFVDSMATNVRMETKSA